jgi:hypothetical protein
MSGKVECNKHGTAKETWVCQHLLYNPKQEWFSTAISDDNPWPDAWCNECDIEFMKYGEWNDINTENVDIKLLCHYCYESNRKLEVDN